MKKLFTNLIILLISLAVIAVAGYFVYKFFSWEWIIFIVIVILTPLLMNEFKNIIKEKYKLSNIQVITLNHNFNKIIFEFYIFLMFVISLISGEFLLTIITSIILYLYLTYEIVKAFINRNKSNKFQDFSLLLNFVLSIVLIIYIIYIIPNELLQKIVTTIIAAIYGGLLTIVGVYLTINFTKEDKKEDLILKNKPFLFIVNKENINYEYFSKISLNDFEKNINFVSGTKYKINSFYIKNVDYSYSVISGIYINNNVIKLTIDQALEKNHTYKISLNNFSFNYPDTITKMGLLLKDMLNNYYAYDLCVKLSKTENNINYLEILSNIELRPIKYDELSNFIKD